MYIVGMYYRLIAHVSGQIANPSARRLGNLGSLRAIERVDFCILLYFVHLPEARILDLHFPSLEVQDGYVCFCHMV